MQSRLFTIFLTLTISPPLIQQLQPVFLNSRNVFQSRENNSKIYSWFAWTTAAIVPELPYSIFAGTIYYACWWWAPLGYRTSSFTSGYIYLTLMLFELYYVGFGQASKSSRFPAYVPDMTPLASHSLSFSDMSQLPALPRTNSSPPFSSHSSSSLSLPSVVFSRLRSLSHTFGDPGCIGSPRSITFSRVC